MEINVGLKSTGKPLTWSMAANGYFKKELRTLWGDNPLFGLNSHKEKIFTSRSQAKDWLRRHNHLEKKINFLIIEEIQ